MQPFSLTTERQFPISSERLWPLVSQPQRLAEWWPGFQRSELIAGDGELGSRIACQVKGMFGLSFEFEALITDWQPPYYIKLQATGDFQGTGEWFFEDRAGQTQVTYQWDIALQNSLAHVIARVPGGRRLLQYGHDRVMDLGGDQISQMIDEGVL